MIPAKNAFSAVGVLHAGRTRLTNFQNRFSISRTRSSTAVSTGALRSFFHSLGIRGLTYASYASLAKDSGNTFVLVKIVMVPKNSINGENAVFRKSFTP